MLVAVIRVVLQMFAGFVVILSLLSLAVLLVWLVAYFLPELFMTKLFTACSFVHTVSS